MAETDPPSNPRLRLLLRRVRSVSEGDHAEQARAQEELLDELLRSHLIVGAPQVPDAIGPSPRAMEQDTEVNLLTTMNAAGQTMLLVFTDLAALQARRPGGPWFAGDARVWMEAAVGKFDGIVIDPAGDWWEWSARELRVALARRTKSSEPSASRRAGRHGRTAKDFGPSPQPHVSLPLSHEAALALLRSQIGADLVVTDTIERSWGWAFTLDTPEHAKSGCFDDLTFGIGPVLVDRHDASVHHCGSSMPAAGWVEDYERRLVNRRRRERIRRFFRMLWPGRN